MMMPLQGSSMDDGLMGMNGACSESNVKITCFSDQTDGTALHFQIIRLEKQIFVWIGFNSARFGHLYAAAPTKPSNTASVSPLLGGASDNVGSGIARRLGSGGEIANKKAHRSRIRKALIGVILVTVVINCIERNRIGKIMASSKTKR